VTLIVGIVWTILRLVLFIVLATRILELDISCALFVVTFFLSLRIVVIAAVLLLIFLIPFHSYLVLFVEEVLRVLHAFQDCSFGGHFFATSANALESCGRVERLCLWHHFPCHFFVAELFDIST
jgi:hypothetical protein